MLCVKLAPSLIVAVVFAIALLINPILPNERQTVDCPVSVAQTRRV